MAKGFHQLNTPIPDFLWDALDKEAADKGESITRLLWEILRARYGLPSELIPKRKRAGRKPKKHK